MKDLRPTNKILGMQIHRGRKDKKIWVSQKNYLMKIYWCFKMQDYNPVSTHFLLITSYPQVCVLVVKQTGWRYLEYYMHQWREALYMQ